MFQLIPIIYSEYISGIFGLGFEFMSYGSQTLDLKTSPPFFFFILTKEHRCPPNKTKASGPSNVNAHDLISCLSLDDVGYCLLAFVFHFPAEGRSTKQLDLARLLLLR